MEKAFKRTMMGLILLAIIFVFVIFLGHICVVCQSNIQADEKIVQNLVSM